MKKRVLAFVLAVAMVVGCIPTVVFATEPTVSDYKVIVEVSTGKDRDLTNDKFVVGTNATEYNTEDAAKEANVFKKENDKKYYTAADFSGTGYATAEEAVAAAQALVDTYQNGDGLWRWSYNAINDTTGYATEAAAVAAGKAAITPVQNGNGKWYVDSGFTGTAYDTDAEAKAAVQTYTKNEPSKFYVGTQDSHEANAYNYKAEAQDSKITEVTKYSVKSVEYDSYIAAYDAVIQQPFTFSGGPGEYYIDTVIGKFGPESMDSEGLFQGRIENYITSNCGVTYYQYDATNYTDKTTARSMVPIYEEVGATKYYLTSGCNGTKYDTEALAQAAATVYQNGDAKWYRDDAPTTPYDTADDARNDAPVSASQQGDGKYYLNAEFEGTGYDTKELAQATVPFDTYQNVDKWYTNSGFTGTAFDTKDDAKNAVHVVAKNIDVYAGDEVSVVVKVVGGQFVAADVTLKYDADNFEPTEVPEVGWEHDGDKATFQFYNAKADSGKWGELDSNDEYTYTLGEFTFEALPGDEAALDVAFAVTSAKTDKNTYIAAEWSDGWSGDAAVPLADANIIDGFANVRLKNMTAAVTAETGLSYKGDNTSQKLLKDAFTAQDSTTGKAITGATIKYALVTKAQTQESGFNAANLTYSETNPTATHAGDYVVYYQISKPGFVTVSDSKEVSIAKASVTLTWSASELQTGAGKTAGDGNPVTADYYAQYEKGKTYANPTATYTSLTTNSSANATVTIDSGSLQQTGTYTFTASISDDYEITNSVKTVLIDGGTIKGYSFANTSEGTEVWRDDAEHTVAVKNVVDGATSDVTVKYSLDGKTWSDEIPKVSDVGDYTLQVKMTADGYYDKTETVNFSIKNVEFKVEVEVNSIMGYSLVLVYTNDNVPGFKYSGKKMYNLSGLKNGYKYQGTTAYTYVYGLVVTGVGAQTNVVPSNEAALTIDYGTGNSSQFSEYDVNSSDGVDINDLVAAQGSYNANSDYLNDTKMSVVLRCDVNRDKKVNTMDCSLIKLHTGEKKSGN